MEVSARRMGQAEDLAVFPAGLQGKRILLCTESWGPITGVSRTTLMLVDHLRSHGVEVAVVAPDNSTKIDAFTTSTPPSPVPRNTGLPGSSDNDAAERVPLNSTETSSLLPRYTTEIRLHGYPLPFNPELSIVYPVRLSALYARTFGAPPDLIYLASPASLGYQVMFQLRQQLPEHQVPLIANFQTDLAGYCAILFPFPLGNLAYWTISKVEGFLFRHDSIKTLFYPSRFVKRYLERQSVTASKLRLLQRGVNIDLFNPSQRSEVLRQCVAPNGEIILVCVARIAGEKGFDFLASVARELRNRGLAFKLRIVGGNRNEDVLAGIRDLFADLVQDGYVEFTGMKTGQELAQAYASADIFLHCSVTETFGLVVLESLASGVPVIARDEGGPSDIVQHGTSGFLVPPGNLQEFVDKTIMLARDSTLRKTFSENARKQACGCTWEKINNTVAWTMLDAIKEREDRACVANFDKKCGVPTRAVQDQHRGLLTTQQEWACALAACIVDARLLAGLGIILGFWGLIGLYLIFIKLALWTRARVR